MIKDAKRYYREIKTLMPSKGNYEKKLLEDIKMRIAEMEDTTDNVTYESLCDVIGAPKTVMTDYYNSTDINYLVKRLRAAKIIRICAFISLAAFLACSAAVASYYHSAYKKITSAVLNQHTITYNEGIDEFNEEN